MVGWFIQQQQVRSLQQQFGQGDAHLPTTGESVTGLVEIVTAETESVQNPPDFRFHPVTATLLEQLLQFGVTLHLHN